MSSTPQLKNDNGFMRDIYHTTKSQFVEENIPTMFKNQREYSLKGIIQETPMSNLFFSEMIISSTFLKQISRLSLTTTKS